MDSSELSLTLKAAVEIAQDAGEIIRRAWGEERHVSFKGSAFNLVTTIDREVEVAVTASLSKRFPSHVVVGEETWDGQKPSPEQYAWYLDPIDGTTNFVHGYPHCAVSLGLAKGDQYLVGVVFNPIRGELYAAYRGGGASLNGQPVRVSDADALERALVSVGPTYSRYSATPPSADERVKGLRIFGQIYDSAREVRLGGSAALDLCYIACGRLDGYWYPSLKPWDTVAGVLILTEAGGTVTDWQGNSHGVWAPSCLATNGKIHKEMLAVLQER